MLRAWRYRWRYRLLGEQGNVRLTAHPLIDDSRIRCLARPHEVTESELRLEARRFCEELAQAHAMATSGTSSSGT
jgi:hypothetical protein